MQHEFKKRHFVSFLHPPVAGYEVEVTAAMIDRGEFDRLETAMAAMPFLSKYPVVGDSFFGISPLAYQLLKEGIHCTDCCQYEVASILEESDVIRVIIRTVPIKDSEQTK